MSNAGQGIYTAIKQLVSDDRTLDPSMINLPYSALKLTTGPPLPVSKTATNAVSIPYA